MTQGSADRELRAAVEHFLFEEAELLDSWQLNEWVELFTEDAISHVPALDDPNRDPAQSVFLVADDLARIRSRVRQLTGGTAPAGKPRSPKRRLITNARITSVDGATVRATANFLVHRCRMERISTFGANTSTSSSVTTAVSRSPSARSFSPRTRCARRA